MYKEKKLSLTLPPGESAINLGVYELMKLWPIPSFDLIYLKLGRYLMRKDREYGVLAHMENLIGT